MAPIKTCVLGTGLSGLTFQIPFILALSDLFSLHSVLERNPTSEGGKVKERFGVTTKIHRSLEDVLADPEIELIIVNTPSSTHFEFAKRSLEAGKHVLVEKPVTSTAAEARQLGELAKAKNLVLYAFQNRRWDSDFLALRRLLEEPASSPFNMGDLVEFNSHYDRYRMTLKGGWKDAKLPASGQTYDLGTHLIDQVVSLFGRPTKVTGFIENVRQIGDPDLDDSFNIILRYPATATRKYAMTVLLRGHIISARDPQIRFAIRGTKGTFLKYALDVQEDQLKAMPSPQGIFDPAYGKEPEDIWGVVFIRDEAGNITKKHSRWPSSDKGCYIELFKNLAGAIRNGEELKVKWEEATTVLEIIEAAYQSSKEERTITLA
ncbi:NAD-binding protein [Fomitiporia mediterranea MF3/22]|uniref:NAD-binding protein n=1 Tax=Fomitiporia mediterranea (strain MF3/22) TaxID=694068 RepID=UPI0004408CCF|nr:NAD-binding protein [Fomitiporia mediterranea MF3/22]EJD00967.1 NAD-binding protein [Fomitiporia mediterranea MF3/22]